MIRGWLNLVTLFLCIEESFQGEALKDLELQGMCWLLCAKLGAWGNLLPTATIEPDKT